jgi:hypothetical protein
MLSTSSKGLGVLPALVVSITAGHTSGFPFVITMTIAVREM